LVSNPLALISNGDVDTVTGIPSLRDPADSDSDGRRGAGQA
jgi:hypothetical protein